MGVCLDPLPVLGLGLVKLRVFEFDVLLERAIGAVAFVASLHVTNKTPLDSLSCSPETFFPIVWFSLLVILEIFVLFLG